MPFSGAAWSAFDIPDGSAPVDVARLRVEPDTRSLTLLVRFPAGWSRAVAGYYEAAEDVVFTGGALTIGDDTYRAGDWAHIPAGWLRRSMSTEDGALALARFAGPARWVRALTPATHDDAMRARLEPGEDRTASPLGDGLAWRLRAGERDSSWLVAAVPAGAPSPLDAEILELTSLTWSWVPAGAPLPDARGLCFCRTFSS